MISLSAKIILSLFFLGTSRAASLTGKTMADVTAGDDQVPIGLDDDLHMKYAHGDVLLAKSRTNVLPNIPSLIWQQYTPFKAKDIPIELTKSWFLGSPSYGYSLLDEEGSRAVVERLTTLGVPQEVVEVFDAFEHPMLRGELVRWALMATAGGIYSDLDVELVQPLAKWVPDIDGWKEEVRLIVGVESDTHPPICGATYPVQFATWTVAGAPGHPVFWTMIDRLLYKLRTWPTGRRITSQDLLILTDPAGWTEVIFSYLSAVTGEDISGQTIAGIRMPVLFGDVLILPIDGFATGVGHSGASNENGNFTMVRRRFSAPRGNGSDLRILKCLVENANAGRGGDGWGQGGWLDG
jgi:alpha 1,6-mannosyltransferase